jgi:hypothetical protein
MYFKPSKRINSCESGNIATLIAKTEEYSIKPKNRSLHVSSHDWRNKGYLDSAKKVNKPRPYEYYKNLGYAGAMNKTNNDILELRSYLGGNRSKKENKR